ncbi:MAG: hypothetical protein KF685_02055 [Acidobacteria bacterium]|nr:hypothetical protein [Acidobacteriota bacterium]
MTKFFLFTLVFVCGLLLSAYGQQNKEKADSPLLASDRPEVYLSFVKLKKFGDISEKNEAERLFLL